MNYEFVNKNPKNRIIGDCAIRALSAALNLSWESVLMNLAAEACKLGRMPNDTKVIDSYLRSNGWECKIENNDRKLKDYRFRGTHICLLKYNGKGHATYVENGKIIDTFNCEFMKVTRYYTKK